jgi:hypothetical protein
MTKLEFLQRGFCLGENGIILDEFGNEYRNEEGSIEFLEDSEDWVQDIEVLK